MGILEKYEVTVLMGLYARMLIELIYAKLTVLYLAIIEVLNFI